MLRIIQFLLPCLMVCLSVHAQQEAPPALYVQLNHTETSPSAPALGEAGMWRQARRRSTLADSCSTNAGATGTCLTRFKCMRQGGTVNGYCGTYGVCCESESSHCCHCCKH